MVNNAAAPGVNMFDDLLTLEDYERLLAVNGISVIRVTRAFKKQIKRARSVCMLAKFLALKARVSPKFTMFFSKEVKILTSPKLKRTGKQGWLSFLGLTAAQKSNTTCFRLTYYFSRGRIITCSSILNRLPLPGTGPYVVSKRAASGYLDVLRLAPLHKLFLGIWKVLSGHIFKQYSEYVSYVYV